MRAQEGNFLASYAINTRTDHIWRSNQHGYELPLDDIAHALGHDLANLQRHQHIQNTIWNKLFTDIYMPPCAVFNQNFDLLETSTTLEVNDRVIVKSATGSRLGTLRYIGEPNFASGVWCGVEFEEANGKNDGSVSGTR